MRPTLPAIRLLQAFLGGPKLGWGAPPGRAEWGRGEGRGVGMCKF